MYRVFQPFRLQPPLVAPVAWLVSATGRTVEADHRIRLTHSGRASPTSIGLRLGLAGSPRRQAESSSSSYGLIVHLPMLSTSPRRDAVPVDYGTQARPRQGLPPCWFDTLTIARVPGLPPRAFMGLGVIREGLPMGCVHAKHRHPADFRLADLRRLVPTRPSGPGAVGTNVRRRGMGSPEPSPSQQAGDYCSTGTGTGRGDSAGRFVRARPAAPPASELR